MLLKEYKEFLESYSKLKVTNTYLASLLGTSSQNISKRINNDSVLSTKELSILEEATGISCPESSRVKKYLNSILNEEILVDYYPNVFGSCGSGGFVASEVKEQISISPKLFNYSSGKQYSVINAVGDSMYPTIEDKDLLIVEHWNGEQITDNRIYIFRFGDNLFIKRLVLNVKQLIIKSDNSMYEPIKLELNEQQDFQIIGKIVASIRRY